MYLRRFLFAVLACFALGPPLLAQQPIVTTLTGAACFSIDVTAKGVVGISVTGSWSGTIQPQISIDGDPPQNTTVTPYTSSTSQTTITANGYFQSFVTGANTFTLCGNTITGTASLKLTAVNLSASRGGGGGGFGVSEVDTGAGLTGGPIINVGTVSLLPALPNGETATTQVVGDTSADVATDQFVAAALSSTGLLPQSGCGVESIAGTLKLTVGACYNYTINGAQYSSPLTTVTLATADPTNPRIDLIGVDITGSVFVTTGTPAATPAEPSVDPTSQLALAFVQVPANATSPTLTNVAIYHENAQSPTEWNTTSSGAPINLASTNNPYDGTIDIEATAATTGNYAQMTDPSSGTVQLQNYNNLVFYLRPKAAWGNNRSLSVQWFSASTPEGAAVLIRPTGTFGFNSSTLIYQQIAIPTASFGINGVPVTSVRFTVTGTGATIGWYLDDITLQGGQNGNPAGTFLTWRGSWASTTGYNPNDVVFLNAVSWVALSANTGSAPSLTNTNWAAMTNAGTNQQVIYNKAGVLSGNAGMLFNDALGNFTLSGVSSAASFAATGAGAFTLSGTEGAAPSGVTGQDILWADNTGHCWKMNNNNGGATGCLGTGSGTVTSIATTAPLGGGTITTTGTLTCTTCVVASSPGAGIAHFAGSTQTVTSSAIVGADMTNNTVTATQLAAQYSKGSCTEVWGGSGTANAMQSGDDAIVNNSCYNDSGVTRTITAVKCRSDNAANTTVLTPTFGSAGTGTAILTGTVTCGNSYAYSATGTLNNTAWTTGTGIDPGMSTVGNATSIAMLVEFTY